MRTMKYLRLFLVIAGIAILGTITVPGPSYGQAERSLRDWRASCDRDGVCSAETTATGRTDAITYRFTLIFRREAKDTPWRVAIRMVDAQPAPSSAFILQIDDGADFRFEPDQIVQTINGEYELTGGAKIDALMAAFRDGNNLWLTFHDPRIRETGLAFSLSGVVASIIWIGEQQLRQTAIIVETIPDRITRLQDLDPFCNTSDLSEFFVPEIHQVSENDWLYIMPCARGAYSSASRLYLENRQFDEIRPLHFATFSEDYGWGGTNALIDVEFDPERNVLTSFARGRGLGDCGSSATYVWRDYDFKLLEYRYWEACDGTRMPADWPVIYQAQK